MRNLIDELLDQQADLQTPVAKFSEKHDTGSDLAAHYRSLIPLSKPGKGEQYAFEVTLDRCTGCKACVSACSSLNGLEEGETWRDVGFVLGGDLAPTYQQTITTACHHCEDPGCLNGCPVGAYEKDQDTGLVRHLDDQCIGCSYCILKCPYDVPKYSKTRGIVRKCDMCHQRLAEGEAPACVQACPTEAIRIVNRKTVGNRDDAEISLFKSTLPNPLSGIPDSKITLPTTRYVGRVTPHTTHAADRDAARPEHPHWPLVFMLVLTQAGLGLCASSTFQINLPILIAGAVIFNLGMIAATLHLGQPLKAWRFFLGLKTSWLSREILAFSMVAPLPLVLIGLQVTPDFPYKEILSEIAFFSLIPAALGAVFTSVMIYVDTKRESWRFPITSVRFFTTFIAFLALGLLIAAPDTSYLLLLTLVLIGKCLPEISLLASSKDETFSADRHSARVQIGSLKWITTARFALIPIVILAAATLPWLALPLLLLNEILERRLFFQACYAPKMPGHF